jgi:hypothetical protein
MANFSYAYLFTNDVVVVGGIVVIVLAIGLQDSRLQTRPRTMGV